MKRNKAVAVKKINIWVFKNAKRITLRITLSITIFHKIHLGKEEIFQPRESISDGSAITPHYTSEFSKHQCRKPANTVRF